MLEIHDWDKVLSLTTSEVEKATPILIKLYRQGLLSDDDLDTYLFVRGYSHEYRRVCLEISEAHPRA